MARTRRADSYTAAGGLRRDGVDRGDLPGRGGHGNGGFADGSPVPGHQLVDALGRVGSEAREDVAQPGLGIDAVELGGLSQRIDGGGSFAALVATGEKPVLAAESDGTDRPLGG